MPRLNEFDIGDVIYEKRFDKLIGPKIVHHILIHMGRYTNRVSYYLEGDFNTSTKEEKICSPKQAKTLIDKREFVCIEPEHMLFI